MRVALLVLLATAAVGVHASTVRTSVRGAQVVLSAHDDEEPQAADGEPAGGTVVGESGGGEDAGAEAEAEEVIELPYDTEDALDESHGDSEAAAADVSQAPLPPSLSAMKDHKRHPRPLPSFSGMRLLDIEAHSRSKAKAAFVSVSPDVVPLVHYLEDTVALYMDATRGKVKRSPRLLKSYDTIMQAVRVLHKCLALRDDGVQMARCLLEGGEIRRVDVEALHLSRMEFWEEVARVAEYAEPNPHRRFGLHPNRVHWAVLKGVAAEVSSLRRFKCQIRQSEAEAVSFTAQPGYVPRSYSPGWAQDPEERITFSWEREGTGPEILSLYGPAEPDLWDSKVAQDPYREVWYGAGSFRPAELNPRTWTHMSFSRRRALMVWNEMHYKDLKLLPWGQLDCFTQYLFSHKPVSATGELMGMVLYNSLHSTLESEVSDSPYLSFSSAHDIVSVGMSERRVWETKHRLYTSDLNELLAMLGGLSSSIMGGKLHFNSDATFYTSTFDISAADSSVHVHLVVQRPQPGDGKDPAEFYAAGGPISHWAKSYTALAYLLNDRCNIVAYANMVDSEWTVEQYKIQNTVTEEMRKRHHATQVDKSSSNLHSPFLGPYAGIHSKELVELLSQQHIPMPGRGEACNDGDGTCIERTDDALHQVGSWKFGCVSVRHHYGNPELIGFEFRSSIDPALGRVITSTASLLQRKQQWLAFVTDEDVEMTLAGAKEGEYVFEVLEEEDEHVPHAALLRPDGHLLVDVPYHDQFANFVVRCITNYTGNHEKVVRSPAFVRSELARAKQAIMVLPEPEGMPDAGDVAVSSKSPFWPLLARYSMAFLDWKTHPVAQNASARDAIQRAEDHLKREVSYLLDNPAVHSFVWGRTYGCVSVLEGMVSRFFAISELGKRM